MAVTPNTTIKILKSPLTLDYKNQLTFANKQAQFNYFNSLPSIDITGASYQRKNSVIEFPRTYWFYFRL